MFSIDADFDRADRILSDLGREQLPYATSLALNETAEIVKRVEEADMAITFDRPTPFTKKALYLSRASKRKLMARVGVKRIQSEYLGTQVRGGKRRPKKTALTIPVKARTNKYGNLPKGYTRRTVSKSKTFVAGPRSSTKHLRPGVYQRNKSGLKLLVAFEPSATYRKRWRFHEIAMTRARAAFRPAFIKAMGRAMATASR